MSVSTHVYGIRPPDDTWRRMKAIWDACQAANIDPPEEVADFFDETSPDPAGVIVALDTVAREWRDDMKDGFEIDLADLPAGVKTLRFVNSY